MGWKVVMYVLGLEQHTQQQNEGIETRIKIELIEKVDEQPIPIRGRKIQNGARHGNSNSQRSTPRQKQFTTEHSTAKAIHNGARHGINNSQRSTSRQKKFTTEHSTAKKFTTEHATAKEIHNEEHGKRNSKRIM